ncbi:CAP domain-containing protein [Sphingomonas mesophila]|uniref:CAP domain-containing protein n=1 Tax=Sphingomonas mesophila TaxID=2303576 RepID=UPI000E58D950|nr:CAP domain-containing protein [Sphingomonas mesophila]
MRRALAVVALAAACAPVAQGGPWQPAAYAGNPQFAANAWLGAHNRVRAQYGSPALVWDEALAAQARAYAGQLARLGRLRHSPKAMRPGQGENLWMGPRRTSGEAMVFNWASERRYFRRGLFPANSSTGRWSDVGHYTQIIWPSTTRLGCGLASGARWDVLVCRYAPAGNRDGGRL